MTNSIGISRKLVSFDSINYEMKYIIILKNCTINGVLLLLVVY